MWGVEFREASNALICATATFEVRQWNESPQLYRTGMGPHGAWIERRNDKGEWERITDHAEAPDFEAILPQGDFGMNWTYGEFMLALTFFGEGYKRGYGAGEWHQIERQRARQKAEKTP